MATPPPIIPWLGGKRRLADIIIPRFLAHTCYVEVFAGGAALYFLRSPAKVEVINDVNGDVVNLYSVVQNHLEEFVRQFKWSLSSREIFKWLQDTPPETLTDIQRAARFFYLQQHSFGGKVEGQTWGTATTAPPVNLLRVEEMLSAMHLRLAVAQIEWLDWVKCVERYDRPHTFFYVDPPYLERESYRAFLLRYTEQEVISFSAAHNMQKCGQTKLRLIYPMRAGARFTVLYRISSSPICRHLTRVCDLKKSHSNKICSCMKKSAWRR